MKKCRINRFDCRRLWKYNRNLMGTCLELDPSTLMIQMPKTKKVSLGFTFGVNISGKISLTDFYQSLNRSKSQLLLKSCLFLPVFPCYMS